MERDERMIYFERFIIYGKWAAGALAAFFQTLPVLTQSLLLLMVVDVFLGVLAAWRQKEASPTLFWTGVTKKIGTLGILAAAAIIGPHVQDSFGINLLMAASAFYLAGEVLSIVRNASVLDVPVFDGLDRVAEHFKGISAKGDKDENA